MNYGKTLNKISVYILISFIILSGCETVIDIDVPEYKSQLVVNSTFSPDSLIFVSLSSSTGFNNLQGIKSINNAEVYLYQNDTLAERLRYFSTGKFRSYTLKPKQGEKYSVKISSEGFNDVYAEDVVPAKVPISLVKIDTVQSSNSFWFSQFKITLRFKDNESENNYYELLLVSGNSYSNSYTVGFQSNDPVLNNNEKNGIDDYDLNYFNYADFSDDLINGKEYNMTILINDYSIMYNKVSIYFASISENLYKFHKTYKLQR